MADTLATMALCAVEDCGRPELSNRLCSAHYQRERRASRLHLIKRPLPSCCEVEGCSNKPRCRYGDVAMCNMHGSRWRHHGTTQLMGRGGAKAKARCAVEECQAVARSGGALYCHMHYSRLRRTGSTSAKQAAPARLVEQGYMARFCKEHPIAAKSGTLYQHREVLFDSIGFGIHQCVWCGCEVEWRGEGKRKLVVDHLDGNKANNALTNLKPSCHRCNANRGLFQSWVMLHRDDPFLWRLYEAARAD